MLGMQGRVSCERRDVASTGLERIKGRVELGWQKHQTTGKKKETSPPELRLQKHPLLHLEAEDRMLKNWAASRRWHQALHANSSWTRLRWTFRELPN